MPAHGAMFGSEQIFHYSADAANANLYTKAGSPQVAGDFVFVVDPGVTIYGSTTSNRGMTCPANFKAGSTIKIIVLGRIIGAGGAGGNGGGTNNGGFAGLRGGDAIDLRFPLVTIDVTDGFIGAGGSGGHGGGGATATFPPYPTSQGGGGGGGQGGGSCLGGGPNGGAGTRDSTGAGGPPDYTMQDIGSSGQGGQAYGLQYPDVTGTANAVRLNGNSVTWIGKTANNVKGPVA